MASQFPPPTDRASFNDALSAVLADHAMLRRLAESAARRSGFSADATLSLADALAAHEEAEAALYALPFLTRTPAEVTSSAARAHRRCKEYTAGNFGLPNPGATAALFVDALLAHLEAEEAWLAHEKELRHERLMTAI